MIVTTAPLRVGLVGAGPHAARLHAPVWSSGPQTQLVGVWARHPDSAAALASRHGAEPVPSFAELLARAEAIAFAVPPAVQWRLAIRAAEAGRHLVLEKPIADTVQHARELARAAERSGVGSVVMLTARFLPDVREFLDRARDFDAIAARGAMLMGTLLDGRPAGWRQRAGALFDLGPHLIDLATAALGPAELIAACASPRGWVDLHINHAGGARSALAVTGHLGGAGSYTLELHGREGSIGVDVWRSFDLARLGDSIRAELRKAQRGTPHACDVRRGPYVQEVLDAAERSLRDSAAGGRSQQHVNRTQTTERTAWD